MGVNPFIEAFGGANGGGAVQSLTPQTRLICGAVVFATCSVAPLTGWCGGVLFLGTALAWGVCCGLPRKRLGATLTFALILFLPLLLLALPARWAAGEAVPWRDALRPPLTLCARGIVGIIVTAATLSTFCLTTFAHGVAALPLPRIVASLIVQFAHQTFLLASESRRMVNALRMRGVPSSGVAVQMRVLTALPVCWLTRIATRAGRVGDAMELRGFDGLPCGTSHARPSLRDSLALTLTLLAFGGAIALRWKGAA
ncbi:MAG: energy-coupling factor transporter transmembrane protein EcfT [Kiritimatiellaeota bacterium]|nr:energy-coupling factor transporter transmembrane protein EcfT [Kiritimatiellota bacterium]